MNNVNGKLKLQSHIFAKGRKKLEMLLLKREQWRRAQVHLFSGASHGGRRAEGRSVNNGGFISFFLFFQGYESVYFKNPQFSLDLIHLGEFLSILPQTQVRFFTLLLLVFVLSL